MNNPVIHRLLPWDILVVLGFLMYFGALICTNWLLADLSRYTDAAIELEANPIARRAADSKFGIIGMGLLATSFIGATYWRIRRNYKANPTEFTYQNVATFAILILILFAQDFLNDLPILLKLLSQGM